MLWQAVEVLEILLNVCWCSMVIMPDGNEFLEDGRRDLPYANIYPKNELYHEVYEKIDLLFDEWPDSSATARFAQRTRCCCLVPSGAQLGRVGKVPF